MVDWQALDGIGGIATAAAVVIGVAFGVIQFRQGERVRTQTAVVSSVHSFLQPHVLDAHVKLLALPDDAPPEAFDEERVRAFYAFGFAVEAMGVLVHDRALDLHMIDRQMGGIVRACWRKARRLAEHERRRNPNIAEWWQWLVERMEEDPAPGKKEGAHVAFRQWRA